MKSTNSWKTMNRTIYQSRAMTVIALAASLCLMGASAFAKAKPDCDCGDDSFEASKDRIKITRSKEVSDQIQSARKSTPAEYERLKKIINQSDTFIQRHMNGDAYQDQDPTGWEEYNGALIAVPLEQWMALRRSSKADKKTDRLQDQTFSHWQLCPKSTLLSVTLSSSPSSAIARYESTIVARGIRYWQGPGETSFNENGRSLYLDVMLNAEAKITQVTLSPHAGSASPYYVKGLQRMTKEWGDVYGTPEKNRARQNKAKQDLAELLQAAKICDIPATKQKVK